MFYHHKLRFRATEAFDIAEKLKAKYSNVIVWLRVGLYPHPSIWKGLLKIEQLPAPQNFNIAVFEITSELDYIHALAKQLNFQGGTGQKNAGRLREFFRMEEGEYLGFLKQGFENRALFSEYNYELIFRSGNNHFADPFVDNPPDVSLLYYPLAFAINLSSPDWPEICNNDLTIAHRVLMKEKTKNVNIQRAKQFKIDIAELREKFENVEKRIQLVSLFANANTRLNKRIAAHLEQ